MLSFPEHPLLHAPSLQAVLPAPLEALASPPWLQALLQPSALAPLQSSDAIRSSIRDLLRHGGYKPTGRGKPASEYLLRAAQEGLRSINAAVDVCNVVSLHSGIPISVVDLDLSKAPHRLGIAPEGTRYVFNASGQEMDVGGLLCLFDAEGPCANAVKDSQRTKTGPQSQRTLTVLWGSKELAGHVDQAAAWYRELLLRLGASVE